MSLRRIAPALVPIALAAPLCAWGGTGGGTGLEVLPLRERSPSSGALFERLPPERTGIDFERRFDWQHPRRHLYAHGYAGGGVCAGDYDGDGRPDLYLVGQTTGDRLYRQVDDFVFEDATAAAGLSAGAEWGTGAVFADVDGDGRLDLYVCNYDAPNRLYLNRGDGTFREAAQDLGLDFRGASLMAAFADYDRDGDLDLYLVTYRLYPPPHEDFPELVRAGGELALRPGLEERFAIQERVIDGERQKHVVQAGQRDRLYRNDGGSFTDVSAEAGITGNHPGFSATWWDYDDDGWPDLHVANDFWDPDRLYHNQRDGTFRDVARESLPSTTWFSMGADSGDLDGDGRLDLLVADMSARTHFMSKLMMGDMGDSRWFLESAEPRQAMRNHLFLGTGTGRFLEAAWLAGLASTDWTWSVKLGDLDCDGRLDAFFTNGTENHTFDPDLVRELQQLEADQERRRVADPALRAAEQWELYRSRPPRREQNLVFRNLGDLRFEDASAAWGLDHVGLSFGSALADLDRDGDLDLVVNDLEDPAGVYRNRGAAGHRALVRLVGTRSERFGVGARVAVETAAATQVREVQPTRGYMSADEPLVHFGLGEAAEIERLEVRWPSGHVQHFADLPADRLFVVTEPEELPPVQEATLPPARRFRESAVDRGLDAGRRAERPFDDYARQPLLPARLSQLGPGLAFGDVDGDGDDDLFVGGSAGWPGTLHLDDGGGEFRKASGGPWVADAECEDMAPLFIDHDADGDLDLYVASGSVECEPGAAVLRDRLYVNEGGGRFARAPAGTLPELADSSGVVAAGDPDRDGDLDLFVGARSIPGRYPLAPESRLLRNDGGRFVDATDELAPGLRAVGLVTSALWSDADGDGWPDLVVACEWGPVSLWRNSRGRLLDVSGEVGLAGRRGWWNALAAGDLDGDGDLDYVASNAGLNTKYHATPGHPLRLYYGVFEEGGAPRLIEAKSGEEAELPVRGLSCSSSAMPSLRERLPTFRSYASARLDEIYGRGALADALVLEVDELASGVFWNEGGAEVPRSFRFEALPRRVQIAPGYGLVAADLDGDGRTDVAGAQNFFHREPETGRWNGGLGFVLRGSGGGELEWLPPAASGWVVAGDATGLALADVDGDGRPDAAVARSEERALLFVNGEGQGGGGAPLAVRLEGGPGNPSAVGARARLFGAGFQGPVAEVCAGGGYLSQSAPLLFLGRPDASETYELEVRWPDGEVGRYEVAAGETRSLIRRE